MRTAEELLKNFKPDIAEQIKENMLKQGHKLDEMFEDEKELLTFGFTWRRSPEPKGFYYWLSIRNTINNYLIK